MHIHTYIYIQREMVLREEWKFSLFDKCILEKLTEQINHIFRKNIIYFNYILMYIAATSLHTCDRTIILIIE